MDVVADRALSMRARGSQNPNLSSRSARENLYLLTPADKCSVEAHRFISEFFVFVSENSHFRSSIPLTRNMISEEIGNTTRTRATI